MTTQDEASLTQIQGELEGLLSDALACMYTEFGSRSPGRITIPEYQTYVAEARDSSDKMTRISMSGWKLKLSDESLMGRIENLVDRALGPLVEDGNVQLPGAGNDMVLWGGYPLSTLVHRLLSLLASVGPAATASVFVDSLREPECAYQDCALLNGVCVEQEVEVYDGVRLVPSQRPDGTPSPIVPPVYLSDRDRDRHRFIGNAILIQDCRTGPRYMNPAEWDAEMMRDAMASPFSNTVPNVDAKPFEVEPFCHALTLAVDAPVAWSALWHAMDTNEIANVSEGGGGFLSTVRHRSAQSVALNPEHIDEAKRLYSAYMTHDEKTRRRLNTAFERFDLASDSRDSIIDLAIAFEVLYIDDGNTEVTYRLKTRVARHLGADLEERKKIANLMAAFYVARSDLVHNGDLKPPYKVKERGKVSTGELRTEVTALCLRSLRSIVTDGMPNWQTFDLG